MAGILADRNLKRFNKELCSLADLLLEGSIGRATITALGLGSSDVRLDHSTWLRNATSAGC